MENRLPCTKSNKTYRAIPAVIITAFLFVLLSMDVSYAYLQEDPRIPAMDHPLSEELAPAIGRIVDTSSVLANQVKCTAWIAQGGVLITAGHCNTSGNILEFNVPASSGPCGERIAADEKDQYEISNVVASNSDGGGNDWKIFEVEDNSITGYQPIEAQLKYINFVKKNVDNSSVPTIRFIDYAINVTPYGDCYENTAISMRNSKSGTLQTNTATNVTSSASTAKLEADSKPLVGGSGGPMIDENTGDAIGIYESAYNYGQGTTLHRNGLWNAFQNTQSTFTLSITQQDESGILMGSTISRWNVANSEFDDYTLTGSSINFGTATEGNAEVFRGDQGVYNNPKEKFNEWDGFDDVRNHKIFRLQDQPYISQFQSTYSDITVTTSFPEYISANGSGQIKFKDPWLIDYVDPAFDNNMRNRGMDAEFYTHSAPFNPGFSSINGKLYNGLFLNENENFLPNLPNYSVRNEPQTINFGGSIGQRDAVPVGWEGNGANFQNPGAKETAVVFTSSSAEARSEMKISQLSDNSNTWKAPGRQIVRSRDGWQHMVYESMGHVWYEAKAPGGDWELMPFHNRMHLDDNGGKSPTISFNKSYPAQWGEMVAIVWQEDSDIKIQTYWYSSSLDSYSPGPYHLISTGESSSFNTQPNVAFSENDEILVLYRTGSGLSYTIYNFDDASGALDEITSGTINGTAGAANVAVASFTSGTHTWFDIAYEKNMGISGPPYFYGTEIRHTALRYIRDETSVTQVVAPHVISSGSIVRNKEPSIINVSHTIVVGWISATTDNSTWDPWQTRATVATLNWDIHGLTITRNNNDHHVRSVSVGKLSDNSEFYAAWSQIYDQSGWIDYNKFVEGSALNTFKHLNTKGWDVQLAEADVAANMHALSYYPKTKPYYWLQSNSLGSSLKQRPFAVTQSRGIVLSDTAATTGFYFGIEDFMAGDVPVAFKEIEQPTIEGDEFMNMNRFPIGRQTLQDVEPWLTSEPFQLKKDADYTFSESFSYGDSVKAHQLLGKKGYITFSATLVDDATGQIIETLREFTIDGKQGFSRSNKPWKIKGNMFEEARVRVEITVETNLTDVQAVIENGYSDDYALGKRSEQHFEDFEFGQSEEIDTYALSQNYPNPFNPTTQITYQLPQESMVRLEVFDLLGRRVQMLVNDRQKTGRHQVTFDASSLASGVYIYRLQAEDFVQSRKLFLVK